MMKNMQPVAPQDRPKVIAVSISLVLALGMVARNLIGTPTLAHSVSSPAAPVARGESTPAAPAGTAAPAPAGMTVADTGPAGPAEASAPQGWGPVPLHDPFHPIAHPAAAAAMTPPPAAAAAPLAAPRPAAPVRIAEARPAPALPAPAAPELPPAARDEAASPSAAAPAPSPVRPAEPTPAPAPASAPPSPPVAELPVTLTGTVGSGATALATFHFGEQTVFARPQEMVGGWRVTRIQVGQVCVSRHNIRHLVLVGNVLPGSAPVASRPVKGSPA